MRRLIATFLIAVFVCALAGAGCTRACSSRDDCGDGQVCAFRIGSCSAQGECQDVPKPGCFSIAELCGCKGSIVYSGCGYPEGYASGPTSGWECSSQPADDAEPGFANPDAGHDPFDAEYDGSPDAD